MLRELPAENAFSGLEREVGFEPTTAGITTRDSDRLSYSLMKNRPMFPMPSKGDQTILPGASEVYLSTRPGCLPEASSIGTVRLSAHLRIRT